MKGQRGFTLMELMVVVAVIAILAALALPNYAEYVRKGKRSDAVRAISELQLALERYRSECPTYVSQASCLDYNKDGDSTDAGEVYPGATSSYYTLAVSAQSTTGYTVTATPKSSFSDPRCGNLSMATAAGVSTPNATGPQGTTYCWRK